MTQVPCAPSSLRLLHGIRRRLSELAARSDDQELVWALQAADVALNELMLREDTAFFVEFYASLHRLLDEASKQHGAFADAARETLRNLPASLDPNLSFSTLSRHIDAALDGGQHLVTLAKDAAELNWVTRFVNTERSLHAYRTRQAARPPSGDGRRTPPTRDEVQQWLKQRFPERPDIAVTAFRALVGGFQKYTILFDTEDKQHGHQSCVMRAERNEKFVTLDAGDVINEFDVVRIAHAAGVPVAEPLWLEPDADKVGRRFFVSRKVAGENYGSAMAMDTPLTDKVLKSFIDALAMVHKTPIDDALRRSALGKWLQYPNLAANTRAAVEAFRAQPFMQSASASAAATRVFTWLLDHVPQDDLPPRLIHVDFGPHNILVDKDAVSAVLDWESARIGDPAEDLAFFIAVMRKQIDRAKAIALYEKATGSTISDYRLRYFDVYNLMKTLVACQATASMYEAEPDASIEWCLLALPYSDSVVSLIEEKIAAAEAAA